jgi:hypothetical protein
VKVRCATLVAHTTNQRNMGANGFEFVRCGEKIAGQGGVVVEVWEA